MVVTIEKLYLLKFKCRCMKSFLLSVLCLVVSLSCFADKVFTPNTNASISGAATYCQNATASVLTYTYNTCNTGTGTNVGTDLTITWYSNTINSVVGGSMESVTFVPSSLTATGSTTFLPSTTSVGTTYYYCVITWDGTGACNATGSLTSAVTSVVVNTAPDAIAGTLSGCVGTVTTLTNTVGGGTWTSATTAKATINSSTGAVSAVAAGTSVISYTIGTCRSTATFTVNANPAAITGTNTVCEGAITTFTDATAGGTWSSSDPSTASVNASNPVGIRGVLAGTATISYTLGTGCFAVRGVTVNTSPAAIGGTLSGCVGTVTTLTNAVAGGTWTSATVAKATIDASTGAVSAVAAGTSVISYTIGSCRSTATFTVNANPAAITGTNTVCEGAITTFTDATAGGTWSTSDPSTASVNASNPVGVRGVLAGTATISYTLGTGCYAVRGVTVNTAPTAITGTLNACIGNTVTLSSTPGGGTWTSATPTRASINSSTGVLSAIASGTALISYTIGSCRSTATFTVNANPAAITGTNTVCEGAITTFTDATAGGTWSTSVPSTATINGSSPVGITGVLAGTSTISYTLGTGCFAVRAVTVNTTPSAITGTTNACVGVLTTLSSSPGGGTWTSATVAKATISATGVVTPVAAGTSLISYTIGTCRATTTFTVNTTPAAITGTNTICENATTTFANTVAGGTWSIVDPTIASLNASSPVTITGLLAGTSTVSYTIGTCAVGRGLTVNTTPTAITGTTNACVGVLTTLSSTPGGGTWTSATTAKATISSGGVVTPVSAGTSLISYTIGACRSTATFTVNTTPAAITGTNTICRFATTNFTNSVAGGTWSTNDAAIATINASSPVTITGVTAGNTAISYTIGTCAVGRTITVNDGPAAITGTTSACMGTLTTLSNAIAGGTWTSGATTRATVTSGGVVTAVTVGTAAISYTIGTCRSIVTFTINANPGAITGSNTVCEGSVTTFTDITAGGTWSSGNVAIATVDASNPVGVTGVSVGTTFITYTIPTSCFVTKSVTVNNTPDPISGASGVCLGFQTTLSNTVGGGTWTTSAPTVATITSGGVVTGLTANSATITYSVGSCNVTLPFSVNSNPDAITGTASVCEGSVTTLSNSTPGGSWSSDNSSVATVDASDPVGVTGVLAGTTTISYTLPTSCYSTRTLTVNPTPGAITGTNYACEGSTTTLSNLLGSGVWTTSDAGIATVNASSGAITGVLAGTAIISYTVGTCYNTTGFTTLGTPDAIAGVSSICVGASTTFTNSALMGTWSSNDPTIATVDATTGVVTGVLAGSTTITYSNGCGTPAVKSIDIHTVPDMPAAITGTFSFCTGTVSTLGDVTASGTWSSASTGVATITTGGVVTGVSGGTSTISYSFTNECGTTAATQDVTVVDYPIAAITSAENPCMNYSSAIVFTGTSGASIVYNIDGGSNVTETLTGGTFNLATGTLSAAHVYELVEVHNATCTTTYDTFATLIPIPMQWVGGTFAHETEWERASNWSCGFVPGDTTDVTIPSGTTYSPLISTTRIVYTRNLTVASGASISADVDAFLYVKGNLSNGGTFMGDGNLSLFGSSAQTITGIGNVSNFELNNSTGATINTGARMTIVKSITMTAGTLTTHDSLTLASDASGTARVAPITFGSSISGNVKVMQYIPGNYRRYRFWSHPFTSSISLSQVQQYMDITGQGGSANGFTTTSSNNPSCYRYDPTVGNSSLSSDPGWRPFTKINALAADSNIFHRYQGIRLFYRGAKGQGLGFITNIVDPNTIGMVGALNQGDQTVALVKGGGANQDYNMVGNPYASPVDIGTVCYNAKTDGKVVGPAFYVWDPFLGAGGQFRAITIGVGAASPYYLQGNSCFQVRVANDGDALTFSESNKGVSSTHNLLKTSPDDVSLVIYDADYNPWDMLSVKFNETATVNEDNDFDAAKLQGGDLNFYTLSADGKKLAIDARPFAEDGVVALGINTQFNKEYIIKSESVVTPGNSPVYLHDKLMNKYVQLDKGTEYRFMVDNNTATQGEQRFELSMKPGSAQIAATKITLSPNPATDAVTIAYSSASADNVSIRVLDVTGVSVYNRNCGVMQSGNINISLKDLSSGIYMVEITSGTNKSVHRLVKE